MSCHNEIKQKNDGHKEKMKKNMHEKNFYV